MAVVSFERDAMADPSAADINRIYDTIDSKTTAIINKLDNMNRDWHALDKRVLKIETKQHACLKAQEFEREAKSSARYNTIGSVIGAAVIGFLGGLITKVGALIKW